MWNLNDCTNELINETNRIRDIENSVVVANGEDGGRGFDWELVISIYKLAYIEWVKNKFLLYTTEKLYSILCDKL